MISYTFQQVSKVYNVFKKLKNNNLLNNLIIYKQNKYEIIIYNFIQHYI